MSKNSPVLSYSWLFQCFKTMIYCTHSHFTATSILSIIRENVLKMFLHHTSSPTAQPLIQVFISCSWSERRISRVQWAGRDDLIVLFWLALRSCVSSPVFLFLQLNIVLFFIIFHLSNWNYVSKLEEHISAKRAKNSSLNSLQTLNTLQPVYKQHWHSSLPGQE